MNVQRALGTNYMVEVAYVGSQGRNMLLKGDPNQAPPVVGVTDANVNRPYMRRSRPPSAPSARCSRRGTLDYHALLLKFQRRFANNFSFLNSYTLGKAIDLNSDNDGDVTLTNVYDLGYNRGPADYDVTHTFASSWIYELPWAREQLYGGWQMSGILLSARRPAVDDHADPGRAVHRHRQSAEPGLRRPAGQPDDRSLVRPSCFVRAGRHHRHVWRLGPRHSPGPGSFNIDASLIKNTRIGRFTTEIRIEAFNLLNHPQFANPNTVFDNAAAGTITAMLSSPNCSLCGTTERQVQLGVKVRF